MNFTAVGKKYLYRYPKSIKVVSMIYNKLLGRNKIKIFGKDNKILYPKAFLKKCKIQIYGNNNYINLYEKVLMDNVNIVIHGSNNHIYLFETANIKDGIIYLEDDRNTIVLGKKASLLGEISLICIEGTKIEIGQDCLFSSDITFRTGDSHSILDNNGTRINLSRNISIGDRVWIGNGVTILKGVAIPDDCVIATGSILTKSITEKNTVIGGNPARIIKKNISWRHERI